MILPALAFLTLADRIRLTPDMVLNESAVGDAALLVDEQDADAPTRPFFPTWTAWQYPVHVAIELGSECQVDKVSLYSETGGNPIDVSTGKPFAWKAKTVPFGGYQKWFEVPVGERTRWLRLTLTKPTSLPEIVVYGTRLQPVEKPKPVGKRRPLPTMDELIGTNAFIDDPIETIAPVGGIVREYHPWGWDVEGKDGLVRFQPSGAAGGNAWFFDDYYRKLKAAGCTVAPVVWQAPNPLFDYKSKEAKPIAPGSNSEDPLSYRKHAEHFFQYAARYGSRRVEDRLLSLAPGQPRVSGLGLLRYLENWNEPDKNWEGREGWFSPYDLAALSSADYDGHRGRLGRTAGIKNADPSMKLVLGGLAGLNLDLIRAIKLWADAHRGGDFPADVLNLHHYSSSAGEQGWKPDTKAFSPEEDNLRQKLQVFADWRDRNAPDREVWITEFGYDTNPGSPISAPPIGKMTAQEVQGAWLVRGILAAAAARMDRAAMFMLRDVDSKASGVFATCGLVTEKGKWERKPSWYYLAAMRKALKGMRFAAEIPSRNHDVRIYRFDAVKGKAKAYALWCPSREDKRVSFQFSIGPGAKRQISLANGHAVGVSRPLPANSMVTIEVGETPTFVIVG
ncbi:hypothetical protein EON82_21370 [bacterium]|nr:MAG: hypothetical protein EON82_21370 [bacterium]